MIVQRIEFDGLKYLEQKLDGMEKKGEGIVKKAVNETARQAKKMLAKKAKEQYTVKGANFGAVMQIKSAKVSRPTAVIEAKGEPLPLNRFKVSHGKRAIKVQVLKAGRLKELKVKRDGTDVKAFVNNIARKGQVRAKDTKKGKKGSAVTHFAVAQRDGKARLGIREKYGNSMAAMLGSKWTLGELDPDIRSVLKKNIEKHIDSVLGG